MGGMVGWAGMLGAHWWPVMQVKTLMIMAVCYARYRGIKMFIEWQMWSSGEELTWEYFMETLQQYCDANSITLR